MTRVGAMSGASSTGEIGSASPWYAIRLADPKRDAAAVHAIYEPSVTRSATSFEQAPPGPEAMAERIAGTMERHPWLIAAEQGADGAIAGYAYGTTHRARWAYQWSAEVAVYVAASAQGRGVGRRLYETLFTILAAMGVHNLYGGVTLPNEASVALHRALGFEEVGVYRGIGCKFGRWHDVQWFQKTIRVKREHDPPLPPPRWLPEVLPDVEAWLAGGAVGAMTDLYDDRERA